MSAKDLEIGLVRDKHLQDKEVLWDGSDAWYVGRDRVMSSATGVVGAV